MPDPQATPDRAAKPRPRDVYAEFNLAEGAKDEDVKRIIDAVNAVALADEVVEAWEVGE